MKKIAVLLLITTITFSQNKEYSFAKIDSICKLLKPSEQLDGLIRNKEKKIIGGFSITTFRMDSKSEIIKGIYSEHFDNKKSYIYDYYSEFYYKDKLPIFLKLTIVRKDKSGYEETLHFNLNKAELEDETEIKNIFLLNLRKKINYMNSQIQI